MELLSQLDWYLVKWLTTFNKIWQQLVSVDDEDEYGLFWVVTVC